MHLAVSCRCSKRQCHLELRKLASRTHACLLRGCASKARSDASCCRASTSWWLRTCMTKRAEPSLEEPTVTKHVWTRSARNRESRMGHEHLGRPSRGTVSRSSSGKAVPVRQLSKQMSVAEEEAQKIFWRRTRSCGTLRRCLTTSCRKHRLVQESDLILVGGKRCRGRGDVPGRPTDPIRRNGKSIEKQAYTRHAPVISQQKDQGGGRDGWYRICGTGCCAMETQGHVGCEDLYRQPAAEASRGTNTRDPSRDFASVRVCGQNELPIVDRYWRFHRGCAVHLQEPRFQT